jgi:mannosyltransferase
MPSIAARYELAAERRGVVWSRLLEHPVRVLGFLTALAFAVRFATLHARGFWIDEAITIDLIQGSLGDLVGRLNQYTLDQPPLYYLLAWGWAKVFGTGEVGLRLLPAICGALTVPVAYLAAAELFSRRAGLVAALLTTLSPLVVWHSQDARPYALVILLAGASFALFVRLQNDRRAWVLVTWAIVSVLAIAAHYVVGFLVAAEVLWLLLKLRRGTGVIAVLAAIVAVGLGVLLLQEHRTSGGALSDGSWTQNYPLESRLLQVPAQLLVGYQPPLQLVSGGVAALLAAAMLALLIARGDARERSAASMATFVCAVGVGVPMLLAATGDLSGLTTRYLVGAWVPLVAIGAAGLTARGAGSAGAIVTACVCAVFLAIDVGSAWEPKFDRDDWRGAAQALVSPRVERAIVVSPSLGAPAFELYRPGARELPVRGEAVREIALVGLPRPYRKIGDRPRPPRPVSRPPWPGFAKVSERRGDVYTIVLFRSLRPRQVRPRPLEHRGLGGSDAAVLLERRSGR